MLAGYWEKRIQDKIHTSFRSFKKQEHGQTQLSCYNEGAILFLYFRSFKKNNMRFLFFICLAAFLSGCNSSSSKKDPGQAMDDTARRDSLPLQLPKVEPVKGTAADIPAAIKLKGNVQEVWKWDDDLGENLLITTLITPFSVKAKDPSGDNEQSAELYAFHYIKKDGEFKQIWMITDAEKECSFDITCAFIKNAVVVTDLDADGIAETTLQYKLACRSDVSPAFMKLIMHEGETKYTLRGLMWYGSPGEKFEVTENNADLETLPGYHKTEDEYYKTFGRYESEKEFATAPPEFLKHARQQWIKFAKENFD